MYVSHMTFCRSTAIVLVIIRNLHQDTIKIDLIGLMVRIYRDNLRFHRSFSGFYQNMPELIGIWSMLMGIT